ncbi:MAG: hypothetical protein IBJ01_17600 [Leptospira sp.]|uniref:hypothetical protein n=1 Tax=Leptospira sp. TaxID=178 RepID=UPI0025BEB484|nr:hypothetical protein [Leptospira sp.]MBL0956576.1 hypothetical protein [Leptospira sp.]
MKFIKIFLIFTILNSFACASLKNGLFNDIEYGNESLNLEINLTSPELFDYSTSIMSLSYYKKREEQNLIVYIEKNNQNITVPEKIKIKCENTSIIKNITNPQSHLSDYGKNKFVSERLRFLLSLNELKTFSENNKCKIFIYGKLSSDDFEIDKNGQLLIRKFLKEIDSSF